MLVEILARRSGQPGTEDDGLKIQLPRQCLWLGLASQATLCFSFPFLHTLLTRCTGI